MVARPRPGVPADAAWRGRWLVCALILAAGGIAACGPRDDGATSPGDAGAAGAREEAKAAVPRAERPTPDAVRDARIDTLLDAYRRAGEPGADSGQAFGGGIDAQFALEKAILAEGAPAMERLLAWLADPDEARRDTATELIPLFGDAAVPAIAEILRGGSGEPVIPALHTTFGLLRGRMLSDRLVAELCRALADRGIRGSEEEAHLAFAALVESGVASGVAEDLGRKFADAWRESGRGEAVLRVLGSLGPGATPAAPALTAWLRDRALAARALADGEPDDDDGGASALAARVGWILAEAGPGTAGAVEDLRAILRSGLGGAAARAAWVAGRWRDAAATAVPELVALLSHPEGGVREAAARALARIPSSVPAARESLVALLAHESDEIRLRADGDGFGAFRSDAAFVTGLVDALAATKDEFVAQNLADAVDPAFAGAPDLTPFIAALAARPEPALREHAIEMWTRRAAEGASPPPAIVALLDDADAGVRLRLAEVLARCGGAAPERLAGVAAEALALGAWHHFRALDLLGRVAPGDPRIRATLLADLDDEDRCAEALARLAEDPRDIPGRHAVAVESACARIAKGNGGADAVARAVVRLDGGPEALAATLGTMLADEHAWRFRLAEIVSSVTALGPRAEPHRTAILALRKRYASDEHSDHDVRAIDLALAEMDGDPQSLALASLSDDDLVRVLAMGDRGRRAAVLLAGRLSGEGLSIDDAPMQALAAAGLSDEIVAAATASNATDPWARERRLGALRLAVLLPSARAHALLRAVEADPVLRDAPSLVDAWIRIAARDGATVAEAEAAADSVRRLAKELRANARDRLADAWDRLLDARPDVVRAADVAPLLESGVARPAAVRLAGRLGSRGRDLLPTLRELRDRSALLRLPALCAIWQIDGDASAALAAMRVWMAEPRAGDLWDPAGGRDAANVMLERLPFEPADAPPLARMATVCRIRPVGWFRALERLGPSAACAVPALRRALREHLPPQESSIDPVGVLGEWVDTVGEAAARALVAIGPAARAALPDLRWRIANVGDARDVLSEAVRRIEAGP